MYAWLPRVLLLCLLPVYAIFLFAPSIGYMHDDGVYMVTARALAQGHGYLIESLPSDLPQTKYPILYPALLSVLWRMIPDLETAVLASKAFSLLCFAIWLCLIHRLLQSAFPRDRRTVDWILFFTAAAPWVTFLGTSALPDMLFACCSTGAILCLSRAEQPALSSGNSTRALIALAGVLTGAGFLLRSAGIALVAAGIVVLARRNWRHAAMFAGICLLLCLPWLIWQASQTAPTDPVLLYYSKSSYARGHIFAGYDLLQVMAIVSMNALMLADSCGLTLHLIGEPWSFLAGLALLAIAAVGWVNRARVQLDAAAVWVFFYSALLLCWAWPPQRYASLMFPFFLMYVARRVQQYGWQGIKLRFASIALIATGVTALGTSARLAWTTLETGTPAGWGDRWTESRELAEWIRDHTPTHAVVTGHLDPMLYLVGHRRAIQAYLHTPYALYYDLQDHPPAAGTLEDIRRHFRDNRIEYVVVTPMNGYKEGTFFLQVFEQLRAQKPGAFRLVKQLPTPGYSIYQVDSRAL